MADTQFLKACSLLSDLVDSPLYGKDEGVSRIALDLSKNLLVFADGSQELKDKITQALKSSQDPWAKRLLSVYEYAKYTSQLDPKKTMTVIESLEKKIHNGTTLARPDAALIERLIIFSLFVSAPKNQANRSSVQGLLSPISEELNVLSGEKFRGLINLVMGSSDISDFAKRIGIDADTFIPSLSKITKDLQVQGILKSEDQVPQDKEKVKPESQRPSETSEKATNVSNEASASFESGVQQAMNTLQKSSIGEWLRSQGEDARKLESIRTYLSEPLKNLYSQMVANNSIKYNKDIAKRLGTSSFLWASIKRLISSMPEKDRQNVASALSKAQNFMDANFPYWRNVDFASQILSSEAQAEEEDKILESIPPDYRSGFSNAMANLYSKGKKTEWSIIADGVRKFYEQYTALSSQASSLSKKLFAATSEELKKAQVIAENITILLYYATQIDNFAEEDKDMVLKAIDKAKGTLDKLATKWETTDVGKLIVGKIQSSKSTKSPSATSPAAAPAAAPASDMDSFVDAAFEAASKDWRRYLLKSYNDMLSTPGLRERSDIDIAKGLKPLRGEISDMLKKQGIDVSTSGLNVMLVNLARMLMAYINILIHGWHRIPSLKIPVETARKDLEMELNRAQPLLEQWKNLKYLASIATGKGYTPDAAEVFKELYPAIKNHVKQALSNLKNPQGSYDKLKSDIGSDILVDPLKIAGLFGNIGMGEHMEANRLLGIINQSRATPASKAQMVIQDLALWGGQLESSGWKAYKLPEGHYLRTHESPSVPMDLGGSAPDPTQGSPGEAEKSQKNPSFVEDVTPWLNQSVYKVASLLLRKLLSMSQHRSSYWGN